MARRNWWEKWKRLSTMSRPEVSTRLRQELQKRSDRLLSHFTSSFEETPRNDARAGSFLFPSSSVPLILSELRARFPRETAEILADANSICAHRFRLLGYGRLNYGEDINWHRDAMHNVNAPRKPGYRINYFDGNQVGDPKITWELNRQQHLVVLAKAYRLTGDERYARELFSQWYSWMKQNPYPVGINWSSSLEVALRSLSWLWISALMEGTSAMPPGFHQDHLRAQSIGGRYVERFLSTYSSPNTHLLGEAVGLFFVGTVCSSLPSARRWQRLGWQIILEEARNQVRADGFHFEQSTYYHVYALDFFLHARLLAAENGVAIPADFDKTLERMLHALAALSQAGAPPRFGDDDGGRVFDSSRNRRDHLRDPLSTGAILYHSAEFKVASGGLIEETLWLLGPNAVERFDSISTTGLKVQSTVLPDSGFYVMASQDGITEQLTIDAGPQGTHSAGHGHADALSLHLTAGGSELLADPGTFEYGGDGAGRAWFRSTRAHNTLQVDGRDQAEATSPFSWTDLPIVKVQRWFTGRGFDVFEGSHSGYERLDSPVQHKRSVIYFKPHWWLVRDHLIGTALHDLEIAWHFGPRDTSVTSSPEAVQVVVTDDPAWRREVTEESYSPAYGSQVRAKTLRDYYRGELPVERGTLLVADPTLRSTPLSVVKRTSIPGVDAYEGMAGKAQRGAVFAPGRQIWTAGDWSSDADLLCYHIDEDGIRSLLLCNGTFVNWQGRKLLSRPHPNPVCELERRDGILSPASSEM
jgi:Heparinase II/III-like protein/Heparinase II/III N-terminus